jgi:pimeloyl-ACP methyl ester carboxylesterase
MKPQVICVPGSVAPAAQRYRPLVENVGGSADLYLKELEVYREAAPPAGYSIQEEVEAIDRLADSKRLDRFHLVGYSGGGFISLAYAGTRPQRLFSLALFEPAQIPGKLTEQEQEFFTMLERKLDGLHGDAFMSTFVREQVKPGAQLPPPPSSPVSPEMQKRPAGIAALVKAFRAYPFDRKLLEAAPFPVFYAYGDLSHQEQALKAGILAQLFADITVRRYSGIHHFVPPEMIYTPEHAALLLEHWRRAESGVPQLSPQ